MDNALALPKNTLNYEQREAVHNKETYLRTTLFTKI